MHPLASTMSVIGPMSSGKRVLIQAKSIRMIEAPAQQPAASTGTTAAT